MPKQTTHQHRHAPPVTAEQLDTAILKYADLHATDDSCADCRALVRELNKSAPARNLLNLNISALLQIVIKRDKNMETDVAQLLTTFLMECLQIGAMAIKS